MTETTSKDFVHRQTAHCESGAISALLRNAGLDVSEALAIGVSGALTFAYIPLIKIGGLPLIAYRSPPGNVIRGVTRRLGIRMHFERFRNPDEGMRALTRHLDAGQPVGLQTSVYWLPYFPKDMRFHFNAHNIVAYGRDGDEFLISDPTLETPARIDAASLRKARFVKGVLAPKGLLYFPTEIPDRIDAAAAIRKSIKTTTFTMLRTPLPVIGVRGIRFVGRKIARLGQTHDHAEEANKRFIGHMVRMQEEIGTGGGGFRFLYASFLQEAAALTDNPALEQVSVQFTAAGDEWRRFALWCAKMIKGRMPMDYDKLAGQLNLVADLETKAYLGLRDAVKTSP
jgi:hypothetical protein